MEQFLINSHRPISQAISHSDSHQRTSAFEVCDPERDANIEFSIKCIKKLL